MNFGKLLVGFGLITISFSIFFFWQMNNPQRLSFNITGSANYPLDAASSELPLEIIIPDIKIDLPIIPAKMNKGKWEATTKGVSYLVSSPIPGQKGNSVLYGHNWPNLLGNITKLKPGQPITIKFADGSVKNFRIDATVTVSPDETDILTPSEDQRITLYTCTGFLDSKRFVVVAKLAKS